MRTRGRVLAAEWLDAAYRKGFYNLGRLERDAAFRGLDLDPDFERVKRLIRMKFDDPGKGS